MRELVKVYSFYWYDGATDTTVRSPSKREHHEITRLGLKPIEDSVEIVSVDDLDDQRRYHPKSSKS